MTKRIVFRGGNAIGIVVRAGEKIGFSVLSPRDHWDQEKGENIAIGRAFTKRRGRPWDWRMGVTRMVVRTLAMAALPLTDETLEKLGNLVVIAEVCREVEQGGAEAIDLPAYLWAPLVSPTVEAVTR